MTLAMFRTVGEALWGPQYVSEMARQLGISRRTATRYHCGERPISPDVAERLRALLAERQTVLARLSRKLNEHD
jgi:plasmid maintenance system antidote protein VapI